MPYLFGRRLGPALVLSATEPGRKDPGTRFYHRGLVPYRGAKAMLDWHIVWWAIAFENVTVDDAWFSSDLQTLSKKIDRKRDAYVRAVQHFDP